MRTNRKELVICRYGEGRYVDWIRSVCCPVIVYNKGPDDTIFSEPGVPNAPGFPPFEVYRLQNIGYEDYVMLRHILDKGDLLADVTVFAQDDANTDRHAGGEFVDNVNAIPDNAESVIPLLCRTASPLHGKLLECGRDGGTQPESPVGDIYEELFGIHFPGKIKFMASALLAVPRVVIEGRPRIFYKRALDILERETYRCKTVHPELCTWTFERLWLEIFSQRLSA